MQRILGVRVLLIAASLHGMLGKIVLIDDISGAQNRHAGISIENLKRGLEEAVHKIRETKGGGEVREERPKVRVQLAPVREKAGPNPNAYRRKTEVFEVNLEQRAAPKKERTQELLLPVIEEESTHDTEDLRQKEGAMLCEARSARKAIIDGEITKIVDRTEQREEVLHRLLGQIDRLKTKLRKASSREERKETSLLNLRNKREALSAGMEETREERSRTEASFRITRNEMETLQREIEVLGNKLEDLRAQGASLENKELLAGNKIQSMDMELRRYEIEREEVSKEARRVKHRLDKLSKTYLKHTEKLNKEAMRKTHLEQERAHIYDNSSTDEAYS